MRAERTVRRLSGLCAERKIEACAIFPLAALRHYGYLRLTHGRGRSSGVEHYLAKVRVVSSNLIARSNFFKTNTNHSCTFRCRHDGDGLLIVPTTAGATDGCMSKTG